MTLQPGTRLPEGLTYLPTTPDTARWGTLPTSDDPFVLEVDPGDVVVIDTVSHEGVLADQGRDPIAFFARHGIAATDVAADAVTVAASLAHDPRDGPHVVTGPIGVRGAQPGDVVVVEVLTVEPRTAYGIVSNRHGRGALPGEMPLGPDPVSTFARREGGIGLIDVPGRSTSIRFPLRYFLGLTGVATPPPARDSVPPGSHGGNLDVALLGAGSRLALQVQVPGAGVYVGDPHFAQGDGEVALTAFEAPLRATLRLSLARDVGPLLTAALPFGLTPTHLVPIGLDEDLDEAMRHAVRSALALLAARYDLDPTTAYAYLSAAGDFAVSQVVDRVKGVHGMLRRADLADLDATPWDPAFGP